MVPGAGIGGDRMKGVTIELYNRVQSGVDDFNRPIYRETVEQIDNVLIGEPSTQEVVDELNLSGKILAYTLAIPKGDAHEWENKRVGFFGEIFEVIGKPTQGIDHLIPLSWNKKVKVTRYGQE